VTPLRTSLVAAAILAALAPRASAAQGGAAAPRADNPHGPSIAACATCHTPTGWKPVKMSAAFRHAEKTFPLDGAHLRTQCTTCHKSLDFAHTPATCGSCHTDVHRGEVGTDCARCHTTRSFVDLERMRRVHELTRFPLRGAHATAQCAQCHTGAQPGQAQYANRATTCVACHLGNYRAARAPDHQAAQFSTDCSSCHGMVAWTGATFDHAATRFPLDGAHLATACAGCHADKVFVGKPTACSSCHLRDYTASKAPPHAAAGFPTSCTTCHTTAAWKGATFDHALTKFPLTGAHRAITCSDCHADNVYKGKPTACASCHQATYAGTTAPPHATAGFPTTCESCHTTTKWPGAVFDHATTAFPLTGAHRALTCADCHADNLYKGKPTACASCHQRDYANARTPSHVGFPTTCQDCHSPASWHSAAFDHSTAAFALTGAHRTVTCASCHGDGVYKGKSTECISCHQQSYNTAALPPHSALGFSSVCGACHTTTAWHPAAFDHATTAFPLTGAHRAATCQDCHADNVYRGKSMACVSCHQSSFSATRNPPHAAAGFPTTCETCHATTAWVPAAFNHATTRFPLTGAHTSAACGSCHGDGVYTGKPTTCVSCHAAKYQAATNPSHVAAGFPQTCESCHNTTTWLGATFDHDGSFFPIYSGAHRGRWSTCAQCHTSAASYAVFTCTTCHAKPTTDSHHTGVRGYVYSSTNCYACHPRGKAG
jgi:hypothetical protein